MESTSLPESTGNGIHAAISRIMADVGGVAKGRRNDAQGYKFRGIADVTLACQPIMAAHQVHIVPHRVVADTLYERETKSKGFQAHVRQRIEFRFYHADGSFVSCETTGEAMDTGDKASNKALAAAKPETYVPPVRTPPKASAVGPKAPTLDVLPSDSATPAASAPSAPALAETPAPTTEAAADFDPIALARGVFGMAKAPTAHDPNRLGRIRTLALSPAPNGLGWAKPQASNWVKKHFGCELAALSDDQQFRAESLLGARLASEDTYNAVLEDMQREGAVK